MRKKISNAEHIEGRIYEHDLAIKTTGEGSKNPGTTYIGGTLSVATDDECLNVVTVNFTYVTPTTSKGTKNATYDALKTIIESGKTVSLDGAANATMVKIDTALGLNDFYTNRDGEETLVSAKRNESGFVHIVTKLGDPANRNTFDFDMLINETRLIEADPERNISADYLIVKGYIFNYAGRILPVDLVVKNSGGIAYFQSLDATSKTPVFTKVWGKIESQTVVNRRETESAFGEAAVKEYTNTKREWVITGAAKDTYPVGDAEEGITAEEVNKALADREIYLAEVKKRQDEYQATKSAGTGAVTPKAGAGAAVSGFNF